MKNYRENALSSLKLDIINCSNKKIKQNSNRDPIPWEDDTTGKEMKIELPGRQLQSTIFNLI